MGYYAEQPFEVVEEQRGRQRHTLVREFPQAQYAERVRRVEEARHRQPRQIERAIVRREKELRSRFVGFEDADCGASIGQELAAAVLVLEQRQTEYEPLETVAPFKVL